MRRVKRLRALTWIEWCFLVRAIFWLPGTAVMLRLFGYQRTLALYSRGPDATEHSRNADLDVGTARVAARMINIAAKYGFYHARCLEKSLVLLRFLRLCSIPCHLVLGTSVQSDAFVAHAWVESRGVVVNDDVDVGRRYAAFSSTTK